MVDFLTPEERSKRMSRIKSRDTVPEVALRKALHALGFRFRLGSRRLPGKPDIVLPKYKSVVFVHGCFWHRHEDCKVATTPKSNTEFWLDKFERNVQRDLRVADELSRLGWQVNIVWECELSSMKAIGEAAASIARAVKGATDGEQSKAKSVASGEPFG
ncbi:DNA mismatch endonuclease Vsr [Rhizobium sp. NXC24]|uniref:very short patch repair endonuclease n=1 Tax=Rhizobium sp. NXC24 TaxID=2048897 RepID=UPI000CDF325C|nr:DNA mismatch endonuclease Vsr [Rhizobium sp. NXC24]AVA21301.1 very short patch repair endonuclease Vsr protein [Rhizobium sp. NXC24]